jgi:hypothetical protein
MHGLRCLLLLLLARAATAGIVQADALVHCTGRCVGALKYNGSRSSDLPDALRNMKCYIDNLFSIFLTRVSICVLVQVNDCAHPVRVYFGAGGCVHRDRGRDAEALSGQLRQVGQQGRVIAPPRKDLKQRL